jgi:hypothetical protein
MLAQVQPAVLLAARGQPAELVAAQAQPAVLLVAARPRLAQRRLLAVGPA